MRGSSSSASPLLLLSSPSCLSGCLCGATRGVPPVAGIRSLPSPGLIIAAGGVGTNSILDGDWMYPHRTRCIRHPPPVYARESVVAGEQYGAPAPAAPAAITAARQQPSPVQLERVWQRWLPLLLARCCLGSPAFPPLYFPSPGAALLGGTMCGPSPLLLLRFMAGCGGAASSMTPLFCLDLSFSGMPSGGPQELSPCK